MICHLYPGGLLFGTDKIIAMIVATKKNLYVSTAVSFCINKST